jgi:trans-aconitate methyltransferase
MSDVIQNFDRSVAGYEAHSAPQAELAAELARWIAPGERHGRAVEFGAGTGLFTRPLQPWNGNYLATDAAPRMVELGRARCAAATWKTLDAREPAGLDSPDWIFSCNLLQWLDEPAAALHGWRKILPSSGQIAAAVLLPGSLHELQTVLPATTPLRWRTADEWRLIFRDSGFAVAREAIWERCEIYPGALALLRAVHAMGLAPRRAAGAGQLRAALRAYDQKFAVPGGVRATWQAWLVRGAAA